MKYRAIKNSDSIIVILEDGGIADIHYAEELDKGDGRQSVTEYYQSRFTQDGIDSEDGIFGEVGEGKQLKPKDFVGPEEKLRKLLDALEWLAVDEKFELDETIWPNF